MLDHEIRVDDSRVRDRIQVARDHARRARHAPTELKLHFDKFDRATLVGASDRGSDKPGAA